MISRACSVLFGAALLAPLALGVDVQAQYFGRNKVQYRTFDFAIIRTEHFDVYYYAEERTAAVDAARMIRFPAAPCAIN